MGMKEKIFRAIGLLGIVGGAALIGANLVLHTAAIVGVGFFSLYLGAILTVVTKRWRNLRAGTSRWLKFWEGRGGRLLDEAGGLEAWCARGGGGGESADGDGDIDIGGSNVREFAEGM